MLACMKVPKCVLHFLHRLHTCRRCLLPGLLPAWATFLPSLRAKVWRANCSSSFRYYGKHARNKSHKLHTVPFRSVLPLLLVILRESDLIHLLCVNLLFIFVRWSYLNIQQFQFDVYWKRNVGSHLLMLPFDSLEMLLILVVFTRYETTFTLTFRSDKSSTFKDVNQICSDFQKNIS